MPPSKQPETWNTSDERFGQEFATSIHKAHPEEMQAHKAISEFAVATLRSVLKSRVTQAEAARGEIVPSNWSRERIADVAETAFLLGQIAETHKITGKDPYKQVIEHFVASVAGDRKGWRARLDDFDQRIFIREEGPHIAGEPDNTAISGRSMLEMAYMRKLITGPHRFF